MGVAVGFTLGLLFAPQPGEETRSQLSEGTEQLRNLGRQRYGSLVDQLRERYGDAWEQGREASARAKDEIMARYTRTKNGA